MSLGVIFDWDGVVINSEEFHRRSWDLLAAELGKTLPEGAFEASFGMRNQQIIPGIFQWASADDPEEIQHLGDRKEELYREIARTEGIVALPGVVALLDDLAKHGVPAVVGSSTPRANIDALMGIIGVTGQFQDIVAADDVTRGKPDPQVFLTAADRLGKAPSECVVIEDAHVGIQAAKAGGIKVLAVATTHAAADLAEADAVHQDLTSVTAEVLGSLLEQA